VEKLNPRSWQGPIESGYGWHLVFVTTVIPGRVPAFEEIEPEVKTAWLGEQKRQASEKAYADMRAKYIVMLPAPPANDGAQSTAPAPKKQVAAPSGEGPL
jgi:parvulin-like peptidyl-prolyl isomerase